jgi:predicted SAM-dependent methyltransferase
MRKILRSIYRKVVPRGPQSSPPPAPAVAPERVIPPRPVPLDRQIVANAYLTGEGIEVGALSNPLPVPPGARVKYVDRMSVADLRRQYPELESYDLVPVDIIDDGERLATIPDGSQDFVIANHFIEHCQNPIMTLGNLFRVLKNNGVLYLGVPDKRFTFDRDREVTTLEHILRDYHEGPEWSKEIHFREWVRFVNRVEGEGAVEAQVAELMETDYSIHFHVWSQSEIIALVLTLPEHLGITFDIEVFLKNDIECIFVLRKLDPSFSGDEERSGGE